MPDVALQGSHRCWSGLLALLAVSLFWLVGCAPQRLAKYPEGSLRVVYEPAGSFSSCLVASVTMAANYLRDERKFTEPGVRQELQAAGLDESKVGDVKAYLAKKGLYLVTLTGEVDGKPPTSLRYWLRKRGYPVICVINRHGVDPRFNHAVVVVGFSATAGADPADIIHYLDPSSSQVLISEKVTAFEAAWAHGQHAMMIVVAPQDGEASEPGN